ARRSHAGLYGSLHESVAAGLYRPRRPGRRAGRRHLRSRLSRFQPRDLCPRTTHLRRDLRRFQTIADSLMAPRREGARKGACCREGKCLMAPRRLAPVDPGKIAARSGPAHSLPADTEAAVPRAEQGLAFAAPIARVAADAAAGAALQ